MKITLRPEGAADNTTDVVLADGADTATDNVRGPAMGSNSVAVSAQQFNAIRAGNTAFINRENRSGSYSFKTSRRFASLADAGRFILTHGMTCPSSGTLIFDFGDTSTGGKLGVLFGCIFRQIGQFEQIGVTIKANYSCVYESAAEVTPASLGYEITSRSRTVTPVESRISKKINCGGWAEEGDWLADEGFVGSTTPLYSAATIVNLGGVEEAVYQTAREGAVVQYEIALPAGTYNLRLHFVELVHDAAEERLFDIVVNETNHFGDFDIWSQSDAADTAVVAGIDEIEVTDTLTITLTASAGLACISCIEITPTPDEET